MTDGCNLELKVQTLASIVTVLFGIIIHRVTLSKYIDAGVTAQSLIPLFIHRICFGLPHRLVGLVVVTVIYLCSPIIYLAVNKRPRINKEALHDIFISEKANGFKQLQDQQETWCLWVVAMLAAVPFVLANSIGWTFALHMFLVLNIIFAIIETATILCMSSLASGNNLQGK